MAEKKDHQNIHLKKQTNIIIFELLTRAERHMRHERLTFLLGGLHEMHPPMKFHVDIAYSFRGISLKFLHTAYEAAADEDDPVMTIALFLRKK